MRTRDRSSYPGIITYSIYLIANVTYDEIITTSVAGVTSILHAAAKEPSVKRVVITSSSAAGGNNSTEGSTQHWDATTWNTEVTATREETDGFKLYIVSKVMAERAAWDFVATEKAR